MAQPRTIEQGRAMKAFEMAKAGMADNKDYKNRVKSFPMMIKTNGLGAAVAFAKGKKDWKMVYNQIEEYLMQNSLYNNFQNVSLNSPNTPLDSYLTQIDSSLYRAITVEVMALFTWLRRFAEGLSKD
ncbi:MAG: type III-B CRISPR module-associated protein Cmr5 [Candidatus Delongbacteria bacterium]|nr:type III-B CRISPR module-associated protein Cmr5 [Candidatus Delongbacteria bacterium]